MSDTKKILYYTDAAYGTLFFSKKGYVGWFHENDADWRSEYMSFIPKFFGGEIKRLNVDLPDEVYEQVSETDCGEKAYKLLKPYLKIK